MPIQTKAEIIDHVSRSQDFKTICENICPEYSDDLFQEFVITLLLKPANHIEEIFSKGPDQFRAWCIRIIYIMATSGNSTFQRKHRVNSAEAMEIPQSMISGPTADQFVRTIVYTESGTRKQKLLKALEKVLSTKKKDLSREENYERNIVLSVIRYGNCKAVNERTGIPTRSIVTVFRKKQEELKRAIR